MDHQNGEAIYQRKSRHLMFSESVLIYASCSAALTWLFPFRLGRQSSMSPWRSKVYTMRRWLYHRSNSAMRSCIWDRIYGRMERSVLHLSGIWKSLETINIRLTYHKIKGYTPQKPASLELLYARLLPSPNTLPLVFLSAYSITSLGQSSADNSPNITYSSLLLQEKAGLDERAEIRTG